MGPGPVAPRYRFGEFILSPRRRTLLRSGREQPLIPRYFDLLVFLVERRGEAVHRRDIFDRVWSDVVVSDSALSQAIRTIRRTLGDDSRDPQFVRTVSRHGYRFVFPDVVEEADDGDWADQPDGPSAPLAAPDGDADPYEPLLRRVTGADPDDEEGRRDAAESLHALGTAEALHRLGTRRGHTRARALLRDTRWDVPLADPVPIASEPSPLATASALVGFRLRRAGSLAAARWAAGAVGAGVAGLLGGASGGLILHAAPDSLASVAVIPVLALIGGVCGATGGAGVAAGLSAGEAIVRSQRTLAVIGGAAVGGGAAGLAAQLLGRWSLAALVGIAVDTGGGWEGVAIGGAAGLAYALSTSHPGGGLAAPRGRARLRTIAAIAGACGLATLAIAVAGRPLVGGTVHLIAQASAGAQAAMTALGHFIGEPDFGPVTSAVIATAEGVLFGAGLALGLTHRRRPSRRSHLPLTSR